MGAPFGILPGQMIRKLYNDKLHDDKCIISEERPIIGTSEMDLTVSRNQKETITLNGTPNWSNSASA